MDDIINKLSSIEDSSQAYLSEAALKKKEIAAEINARKELWKRELDAETKTRISALQKEKDELKAARLSELRYKHEQAYNSLQDIYNKYHDKYVDKLFFEITQE